MATYDYPGYDDDQISWPGGTVSNGDTITFTQAADHLIQITDNDIRLQDGTDDRDDEDGNQTAIVYDELGAVETSGQVQPRDEITLTDGTNTHYMTEVYIASSNSYYYIFHDPAPVLGVEYTVTNVSTPNSTFYSELSTAGVMCFVAGTLIATPQGECPIEQLQVGDRVSTLDRGPQPILWIGRRRVNWHEMKHHKGLRPFKVRASSLGPGCPVMDTWLSRQHRVLLTQQMVSHPKIGVTGAFAPVHTLTELAGIEEQCPTAGAIYLHIVTENHNVIWSNGMATETLLPTAYSTELANNQPGEILRLPRNIAPLKMRPARAILNNQTARRISGKIARSHEFHRSAGAG